jgi:tryptophanyl-tRNA synthetase
MNNKFGDIFVLPADNKAQTEFANRREPVRIRSLRNPDKKMSKSVADPAGTIMLTDKPEEAAQKILSATTDSLNIINYDWEKQPGLANILTIYGLLEGQDPREITTNWNDKGDYKQLKNIVAERVKNFLMDLQKKLNEVDEADLMKKLTDDEASMTIVANATLLKAQKAVGLRPKN